MVGRHVVTCALLGLSCNSPRSDAPVTQPTAIPAEVVPAVPALTEPATLPPQDASAPVQRRGSLSKELIRRTIGRHMQSIRLCWEEALKRDPAGGARMGMWFRIAADGSVESVKMLDTTVKDDVLVRCVDSAVKAMKFPPPEGGGYVDVTYPFLIHTTGG